MCRKSHTKRKITITLKRRNSGFRFFVLPVMSSRIHPHTRLPVSASIHSQAHEMSNVFLCDSLRAPNTVRRSGRGSVAVLRSDPTPTWPCCMPMATQHAPAAVRLHDSSPWLTFTLLFCPRHCCSVCVHGDDSDWSLRTSQQTDRSPSLLPSTGIAAAVSMSPFQWCAGITRRCITR